MSISSASDVERIAVQIVESLRESEQSVAELYVKGCEALWTEGTPRDECASKFAKIIRDKMYPDDPKARWDSGYYWRVTKDAGFTPASDSALGRDENSSDFVLRLIPDQPETYPASPQADMRLAYIKLFQDDMEITKKMIKELQKNYEDLVDPVTGETAPDTSTPRDWSKLFASITPDGQITHDSPEDINNFFTAIRDLHVRTLAITKDCMDNRQALIPSMLYPLKAVTAVTSKAHFGKNYYVMFKRRFGITTKKITQFVNSDLTYADYLNFVRTDAWHWGYSEFIPCPNCYRHETENQTKFLLQMHPQLDGTWKWRCDNCGNFYPAGLIKERLGATMVNRGGCATTYLQKNCIPIPEHGDE